MTDLDKHNKLLRKYEVLKEMLSDTLQELELSSDGYKYLVNVVIYGKNNWTAHNNLITAKMVIDGHVTSELYTNNSDIHYKDIDENDCKITWMSKVQLQELVDSDMQIMIAIGKKAFIL